MAIYVLEGTGSARLPRRPLTVTLTIDGNPASRAALVAKLSDGSDAPVRRHSAGMLIIPRVDDDIVITAVPDQGRDRFDPNTVLHIEIRLDSADPNSDRAQLSPREVSGLASIELAVLTPDATDQITVTTRLQAVDAPLPLVAARARVDCRGAIGVDQLPVGKQVSLSCVIDASVSMAARQRDGSLAAAIDIVAGIAAVISGSTPVHVVVANDRPTALPAVSGAELSGHAIAHIADSGYGVGAGVDAAVQHAATASGLTIVITDAPAPALHAPGAVSRLVLTKSSSAQRYPGFTGAVCPPPPSGTAAAEFLGANPHVISTVVIDLVAPLRSRW